MDIFGKIKEKLSNEFIDIVEWLDYTDDTIAHRFERYQNEIKNGAKADRSRRADSGLCERRAAGRCLYPWHL